MTLRLGARGPEVGVAQQALLEAGLSVDAGELALSEFGASTELAVHAFQAAHVDLQGHALAQDGAIGPATAWALEHPGAAAPGYTAAGWRSDIASEPEGAREVLAAAIAEIGTREEPDGSNRGPRVDVYTAPYPAIPWCAAFVSWAWSRREGGSPFGRIYSAHGLADWGQEHGRIVTIPQPGDVWTIFRDDVHGHAGLVVLVRPDGTMCTVEGNSGNAVRGLIRPLASIARFIRPLGDLS
jgi:hypothetical protein